MKKTRVQKIKQAFDIFTSARIVMAYLFRYPAIEFTLSEIAAGTKLSKATVSGIIQKLADADFVTLVDLEVVWRIRANTGSWMYRREKIAYNIQEIIRSGIVEFLADRFKNPKCILLTGSFRNGEDGEDSDIDIAIEVAEGTETGTYKFEEFGDFERRVGRNVAVHVFSRNEIDKNVFLNIANGIVLYGFLEVAK